MKQLREGGRSVRNHELGISEQYEPTSECMNGYPGSEVD